MAHHPAPAIVLAPDKFKSSLTAPAVCAAIARGLVRVWPDADVRMCPMADGGDGTLDAVLARGGERRKRSVTGAGGRSHSAPYGVLNGPNGRTAVLEVAQIVGITDPEGMAVPVARRTTRGVGELLRALLDEGVRSFMIGLGGSSTNDAGAGLLAALGLKLVDARGAAVAPTPEGLAALARVDATALDARIEEAAITIMSDVNNPLCGERGATAIFGPQKGVRLEDVAVI
ncbi:MAG TPA: glycerate kinase, partial [Casimicrobiaceae bacterium]